MTTSTSQAPFAGHPVYDEATRNYMPTPRPAPRVKPEAEEFAARNRGSLNLSWEASSFSALAQQIDSAGGRFCSTAGKENLLRSRGTLGKVLAPSGYTPRDEPVSRSRAIKPEAEASAEQHKGGRMNRLLANYGKNDVTPRPQPRVKTEASANYNMSRGSAMNSLLHDPQNMPGSARAGPRVKPEAEGNAMKNRGSMNSIMRTCTPRY